MHVSLVLQEKGSDVVTAGPSTPLAEVVATLADRRIGAVVIIEADRVVGIVAERDVVRVLAERGADALRVAAAEVMDREVTTCAPEARVETLMEVMTERRVRHIPVLEEDRLAGLVSIGDVVKSRISNLEHETEALHSYISNPY